LQNNILTQLQILPYRSSDQAHIARIPEGIRPEEPYAQAFEQGLE
jgi:hypothetical protein